MNGDSAVDPIDHSEGFSAVLYDNENGLPTSESNAIAETGDGFIWIGSYSGLIRYDGASFQRVDSSTGVAGVKSLYAGHLDRLWIGTNDSGLVLMEQDQFRHWDKTDGLKSDNIRFIAEEQMFGLDRMLEALNEAPDAPPQEILKNMRRAKDRFVKDAEQFDDLTMLCIEYNGGEG